MKSVFEIVDWFLWRNTGTRNERDEEIELLTHLKLQKLLYYAQGCNLALYKESIFKEKIYAWYHGPVVKEIYNKYCKLKDGSSRGSVCIDYNSNLKRDNFTDKEEGVLNFVFEEFGQFSAWKLRDMVYDEQPWKNTSLNKEISTELMREYFTKEYLTEE